MFQMLVLANGQRNLLRVPGGVGDGLAAPVGVDVDVAVAVAVGMAVAVAVGCGVLVSAGEGTCSPWLGVTPAGVLVLDVRDSAWPHAPSASITPAESARSRACRAPNGRNRGCTSDSDVFLTSK
jgi:hypothetical protein